MRKSQNLRCHTALLVFNGTLSLAHQGYTMSVNSVRVMVGLASPPLEVDAWLAIGRRPLGRCHTAAIQIGFRHNFSENCPQDLKSDQKVASRDSLQSARKIKS
jgi:hypothetical protein